MPFFKITLIRSAIGLPSKTARVLNALGLRNKRNATVFQPINAAVAGQIMQVKELIAVSEVETALSAAEMRELRKPDPGFWVERKGLSEHMPQISYAKKQQEDLQ